MPQNGQTSNSLPGTAGQLLNFLFPSTAELRHDYNRNSFYNYLLKVFPGHKWISQDHTKKTTEDQPRTKVRRPIAYKSFSRRISDAIDEDRSYVECASLSKPLISFYWSIAEDPALSACCEQSKSLGRYAQRCFLDGLSQETSQKQVAFLPLDDFHLHCVDQPEEYDGTDRLKEWRYLCVNGKTDLYRTSLTLFRLKHQLYLKTSTSPLPVLRLGIVLARTCIPGARSPYRSAARRPRVRRRFQLSHVPPEPKEHRPVL
jgi:hypothetical protein